MPLLRVMGTWPGITKMRATRVSQTIGCARCQSHGSMLISYYY